MGVKIAPQSYFPPTSIWQNIHLGIGLCQNNGSDPFVIFGQPLHSKNLLKNSAFYCLRFRSFNSLRVPREGDNQTETNRSSRKKINDLFGLTKICSKYIFFKAFANQRQGWSYPTNHRLWSRHIIHPYSRRSRQEIAQTAVIL